MMDQKKYYFIAVCVQSGDVLGTGLTQERALRISLAGLGYVCHVWWNCGPFPLSNSCTLCSRVFCSLLWDRFLKIARDLRKPRGCSAENWEQLGVDTNVPPALFLDLLLFSMLSCCWGWWQEFRDPYYFTNIFWHIFLSKKAITIGLSIDVVI